MPDPERIAASSAACTTCGQVHQRCSAHNKAGAPCGGQPRAGQTVCRKHGANTPQALAAAGRRLMADAARADLARLGVAIETTPVEALEAMLAESAGNVTVLRQLVDGLKSEPTVERDDDGLPRLSFGTDAIYGPTFHESGMPTGKAERHILVTLYNEERDRLHRIAKDCAALGIDERKVRLQEAAMAAGVERVVKALNKALSVLPNDQREAVRVALGRELRTS